MLPSARCSLTARGRDRIELAKESRGCHHNTMSDLQPPVNGHDHNNVWTQELRCPARIRASTDPEEKPFDRRHDERYVLFLQPPSHCSSFPDGHWVTEILCGSPRFTLSGERTTNPSCVGNGASSKLTDLRNPGYMDTLSLIISTVQAYCMAIFHST